MAASVVSSSGQCTANGARHLTLLLPQPSENVSLNVTKNNNNNKISSGSNNQSPSQSSTVESSSREPPALMVDSSPLDLNLAHGVSSGGSSSAPMRFPFQHHQVPGFGAVIGVPSSAAAAAKQVLYLDSVFRAGAMKNPQFHPRMRFDHPNFHQPDFHAAGGAQSDSDSSSVVDLNQNVLDLRGDPPHDQDKSVQIQGGFACALDLVTHIRAKYGNYFGVTVAGYPEAHTDAIAADGLASPEAYQSDLAYLKRKVDA